MEGENNSQAVNNSAESAPVETQNAQVNSPAAEQAVAESNVPENVPYSRFKEVIDSRNQFESQIEELRNRLTAQEANVAQSKRGNVVEKYEQALVKRGFNPDVAKAMAEVQHELVNEVLGERMAPLEQETAATRVDQWVNKLAQTHKDWYELEPAMEKILDSLPKQIRGVFIASPEGLEMLYAKAKLGNVATAQKQAFTEGANAAYQNKGLKNAVSPTPGASVPKPQAWSREKIMAINSEAELRAHYNDIINNR